MSPLFYVFFSLLFFYLVMLGWLAFGFIRSKFFISSKKHLQLPVTIIICARNEERHIPFCLRSVLKQEYDRDKIQLILINDASSDKTLQIAETILINSGINYKIISNQGRKGKKESITEAMPFVTNELIITRDADTFTLSPKWLRTISDFKQETSSDFIIAPISIIDNTGLLWALQAIENNVLAVFACGSAFYKKPFLCSGANLAFTKTSFEKVNGYSSHIEIASGDDVLFMEDIKKIPGSRINYLKSKDAIAYTFPCFSFGDLIRQKTRWASKFKWNRNPLNFILSFLIFSVNLVWIICFISVPEYRSGCLLFIFLKLIIDILLLFLASGFIKNKGLLWLALPVGCIYPLYASIVGISSMVVKPKWK